MTTLTITARGQVTFKKSVMQHLGIAPGEKVQLDLLPDGRVALSAAKPSGGLQDFIGLLAGKTSKVATLDEINDVTAKAWAGQK